MKEEAERFMKNHPDLNGTMVSDLLVEFASQRLEELEKRSLKDAWTQGFCHADDINKGNLRVYENFEEWYKHYTKLKDQ